MLRSEAIPEARVRSGAVYEAYKAWASAAGLKALSHKALGKQLLDRGLGSYRDSGNRCWYPFGLTR